MADTSKPFSQQVVPPRGTKEPPDKPFTSRDNPGSPGHRHYRPQPPGRPS